ncbi:MAG: porin family protein [Sinomicrobium sp.]|nr:porin family protein [Sinomicrobium sp.]
MKKLLLCSAAVMMFAPAAHAESVVFKPYIGVDFQHSSYSYNKDFVDSGVHLNGETLLENGLNGFNIHVGNRFNDYIGLELGYFRTKEGTKDIKAGDTVGNGTVAAADFSTKVKTQGVTLDALGYLPLGTEKRFDLIGTAGLSWTKADLKIDVPGVGSGSDNSSEIGFRAGAGAQFHVTDKVNIRGIARYQNADFDSTTDHAWVYTLGVNYSF